MNQEKNLVHKHRSNKDDRYVMIILLANVVPSLFVFFFLGSQVVCDCD